MYENNVVIYCRTHIIIKSAKPYENNVILNRLTCHTEDVRSSRGPKVAFRSTSVVHAGRPELQW